MLLGTVLSRLAIPNKIRKLRARDGGTYIEPGRWGFRCRPANLLPPHGCASVPWSAQNKPPYDFTSRVVSRVWGIQALSRRIHASRLSWCRLSRAPRAINAADRRASVMRLTQSPISRPPTPTRFYELGEQHAVKPATTMLLFVADGRRLPFDVAVPEPRREVHQDRGGGAARGILPAIHSAMNRR